MKKLYFVLFIPLLSCSKNEYEYEKIESKCESCIEELVQKEILSQNRSESNISSTSYVSMNCAAMFSYIEKYTNSVVYPTIPTDLIKDSYEEAKKNEIELKSK
jgi:hypothetical protein